MSNIWDSVLSVYDYGSKNGSAAIKQIFHSNCGSLEPRTVSIGTNTEVLPAVGSAVVQEMPVSSFVRLAGLSGAAAVALGAYGAHVIGVDPDKARLRATFDTANKYHLIHSVALMAVPLARVPRLSGSLFLGGMLIFSGTTYYHALTEDNAVRQYTPYGGVLLILGWLSLIL